MTKGDRVRWLHLPDKYRYGTVEDIDGTIGVRTDDTNERIYIKAEFLEEVK